LNFDVVVGDVGVGVVEKPNFEKNFHY